VASQQIRDQCLEATQVVPSWCQVYKVSLVKSEATLHERQLVAGREQARAGNVMVQGMSNVLDWLHREFQDVLSVAVQKQRADRKASDEAAEDLPWAEECAKLKPQPSLTAVLESVYDKTGKIASRDGTKVCYPNHFSHRKTDTPSGHLGQIDVCCSQVHPDDWERWCFCGAGNGGWWGECYWLHIQDRRAHEREGRFPEGLHAVQDCWGAADYGEVPVHREGRAEGKMVDLGAVPS
jgi:hypothetical protein